MFLQDQLHSRVPVASDTSLSAEHDAPSSQEIKCFQVEKEEGGAQRDTPSDKQKNVTCLETCQLDPLGPESSRSYVTHFLQTGQPAAHGRGRREVYY